MDNARNFVGEQFSDPRDSTNLRILQGYRDNLENIRDMVLYERSQLKITQASIDELERYLSNIIGGLDKLRRMPNIDELHSSLDEVQANVRKARKCLHVASKLLERGNSPRYFDALFDQFEQFSDCLFEAIELLDI